ncbi:MAG: glycosyltransferase family 9 protein [Candidatus Omnitrophica bacterium]|nr:glycosyltransferase family 9 protein [Candidatus Omnitrophota bacterium]
MKTILKQVYLFLRSIPLVLLKIFIKSRNKAPDPTEIKNILIIRIDRIGDMVCSVPTIESIRRFYPQAKISLLVNHLTRDLLKDSPLINNILIYGQHGALNANRFDLVFDLIKDYTLQTAWLAFLTRARYRVGFDIAHRGAFFNLRINPRKNFDHIVDETLELTEQMGICSLNRIPVLCVGSSDDKAIDQFFDKTCIKKTDLLIGIQVSGFYPTQRWIPQRFAETADYFVEKLGAKIILLGAKTDEGLLRYIQDRMKHQAVLCHNLSLSHLKALLKHCHLLVCNNSGPLHMAAALGVPTVSTMGPTVAYRWWPRGKNHIVVRKELNCIGCNSGVCRIKTHDCMQLITVDDVITASLKILHTKTV